MGLYDRDYAQAGSTPSTLRLPSSMVMRIILVTAIVYLVDNFSVLIGLPAHWVTELFKLNADFFFHPWQAFRLLTYGFVHDPIGGNPGIFHILFNMYGLWLFGRALEHKLGSKEFLALYLTLIVLSGLVWALIQNIRGFPMMDEITIVPSAIGASGAVVGMLVLFAINYPKQKFLLLPIPIPIPAWALGIILVLMDASGAVSRSGGVAYTAHLAGAGWAAVYYLSGIRLSDLGRGFGAGQWNSPRLKVFDQGRGYEDLDRRADQILEKVHRQGAESITAAERKILDDYSRRMRDRRS